MKRFAALCLLISTLFLFVGCNEKEFSISYDINHEPQNLDPQTAIDLSSLNVIYNIYTGLFSTNATGNIKNEIASDYQVNQDGLIYTISLRQDALWENKEKVTANDFVFGLRRLLAPRTKSEAAKKYFCIMNGKAVNSGEKPVESLGVKAKNDYTLEITLEYPNEDFIHLLSLTYAYPCNEKFFYDTEGRYGLDTKTVLANGCFTVYKWKHDISIVLAKNDTFYDKNNVNPAAVKFQITSNEPTIDRLMNGEIDASLIDGIYYEKIKDKGFNYEPIEKSVWGLEFNLQNKYFQNDNIRYAITRCFNRDTYKDKIPSILVVAEGIIPHSVHLYNKQYRDIAGETITSQFDASIAYKHYKKGLEEIEKEKLPGFSLLVNKDAGINSSEYFLYASQILQKELGLFINIEEADNNEYNNRLKSGDYDIVLYKQEATDNTPLSILNRFTANSKENIIGYSSSEYDSLMNAIVAETNKQKLINLYVEAEKMLINNGIFIPMYYNIDYFVVNDKTTGLDYNIENGLVLFKSAVKS